MPDLISFILINSSLYLSFNIWLYIIFQMRLLYSTLSSLPLSSPPLSSPLMNLGESWSLKFFFTKNFMQKIMPLNLLWTRSSYFVCFSYLKYDEVIIKQPSSCSFGIKVVKLTKFLKIFKNKKSPLSSSPHEFGKVLVVWGLDNVEYGIY